VPDASTGTGRAAQTLVLYPALKIMLSYRIVLRSFWIKLLWYKKAEDAHEIPSHDACRRNCKEKSKHRVQYLKNDANVTTRGRENRI
jgi:hypothetical protein